jgi:hypothetical protein
MVGQNGPATIYSSSHTNADVRKPIVLDEKGIHLLPAEARVSTRLSINDVTARRRIVERIAQRRAYRSQGQAQSVTSQRIKTRLEQEVDQDAAGPLKQARHYYETWFRQPLILRDALPKLMRFTSTSEHLRLLIQQCSQSPLPAPLNVPVLNPNHDIAVAIHESAVESVYEIFFGGNTAHDRNLLNTAHLLTGEDPRPLRVHSRTPRWSIRFADHLPLKATFEDGSVGFTVHATMLDYGDRHYDGEFSIKVLYRLEETAAGPRLARVGEVQVNGSLPSGSPGEFAEPAKILHGKFSALFPPAVTFDGFVPPTGGVWDKLRALELAQLDAQDGWLKVSYQLPRPKILLTSGPPRNKK